MQTGTMVAIKIVSRYSKRRRLGGLGTPEDQTKREVAILKRAHHKNVVALHEVIDDVRKNKVYLVLEYAEHGEIKWHKKGVPEIVRYMHVRYNAEKTGAPISPEERERQAFSVEQLRQRMEAHERNKRRHIAAVGAWSLEHGDDYDDDETQMSDVSRSVSRADVGQRPPRTDSNDDYVGEPLAGSMFGSYVNEPYRNRAFSLAGMSAVSNASHVSSEFEIELDQEETWVPALTLEEARHIFRDVLQGLEFLHGLGIIHRDLKPANLLVSKDGIVKISDFGVSYLGHSASDEDNLTANDVSHLDDDKELARSVGTLAFWAPEVCYWDEDLIPVIFGGVVPKVTAALDLWALGVTLYCLVYARLPFLASAGEGGGLIDSICKEDLYCPRERLVPVDTSTEKFTLVGPTSMNSNKRLDYDLKFEAVPDAVRDLISKLLIKDPAKRMTIAEAKAHPWVTENLIDTAEWLAPSMDKEKAKRIVNPDEKEVSHAIVKRSLVERAISTTVNFAGKLMGRKEKEPRNRASSTATSASQSSESVASPTSTITAGKGSDRDARRSSLRGDELLIALKNSRDQAEHPLAQSQTASPDLSEVSPSMDEDRRPRAPDRTVSAISAADSIRTIRAPQPRSAPLTIPELHAEHVGENLDPGLRTKVENLWEGTTRTFERLASRTRWRTDRSPSSSRASSMESDVHAGASVGLSKASATGSIATPDQLMSPIEYSSNSGSALSPKRSIPSVFPESSDAAFEIAQDMNQRRHIQEHAAQSKAEAAKSDAGPVLDACPPSPDDIDFPINRHPMAGQPSASTIASSGDDFGGNISQNLSNPSFGFISSNASSPPADHFLTVEKDPPPGPIEEPAFMRTADTVIERGSGVDGATPGIIVATGKPLEDRPFEAGQPESGYMGKIAGDGPEHLGVDDEIFDDDDEDDYESDDDDGVVMMNASVRRG
jgi:SNF1-activating kinase 1